MSPVRVISLAVVVFSLGGPLASAAEWPHYAANAARTSIAPRATRDLDTVAWSATPSTNEEYVYRSGPVVHGGRVFVNTRLFVDQIHENNLVVAYDLFDGASLWATPIEPDVYDSCSSPAADTRNQTVLLGSGQTLYALNMITGSVEWQTALERAVVNAAPAVTTDLFVRGTPTNRALITDYCGYGDNAKLYAINVDPNVPPKNPYAPGEIVWTADLPGASGNTPAYQNGAIYVASVGGTVKALNAADGTPIWETNVQAAGYSEYAGFYGGVGIRNGYVYAASYVFSGSGNNSGLFKFDADNGDILWVTPCERTNAIPIVTDDGRIYLSAGIDGFGSAVKIQAFQDNGDSATPLWDTYADTDGALIIGGYNHQPAWARGYLYAGTPPPAGGGDFYGPYTDLHILDSTKTPDDPSFIVAHHAGSGGTPAVAAGTVYSLGDAGLFALDPSPACLADLDGDGVVGVSDLAAVLGAYGMSRGHAYFDDDADLNRDGTVDLDDLAAFLGVYGEICP